MECQTLFSGKKIEKNITKMSSAEFILPVLKVILSKQQTVNALTRLLEVLTCCILLV